MLSQMGEECSVALLVEESSAASRTNNREGYLPHKAEEIALSFLKSSETHTDN